MDTNRRTRSFCGVSCDWRLTGIDSGMNILIFGEDVGIMPRKRVALSRILAI